MILMGNLKILDFQFPIFHRCQPGERANQPTNERTNKKFTIMSVIVIYQGIVQICLRSFYLLCFFLVCFGLCGWGCWLVLSLFRFLSSALHSFPILPTFCYRRRLFMQNMTYNNIIFLHLTYYPVACFPLCCMCSSLFSHIQQIYRIYAMVSCHSFIRSFIQPASLPCLPNKRTNTKLKQKKLVIRLDMYGMHMSVSRGREYQIPKIFRLIRKMWGKLIFTCFRKVIEYLLLESYAKDLAFRALLHSDFCLYIVDVLHMRL